MDKPDEVIAANLILPLVKDLVLPKVQSLIKKFSLNNNEQERIYLNFEEYLNRRYIKYLILDTLVFPNKQTQLDVLYEPLTIVKKDRKDLVVKMTEYPKEFLSKFYRVIIEDTAGMGKSTILKKIFLSIVRQKSGIPILIELRQINNFNNFFTEIQKQLSPLNGAISIEAIKILIQEGGFIFLFDGFDEISKADKEFVINDLHRFIEYAKDIFF